MFLNITLSTIVYLPLPLPSSYYIPYEGFIDHESQREGFKTYNSTQRLGDGVKKVPTKSYVLFDWPPGRIVKNKQYV